MTKQYFRPAFSIIMIALIACDRQPKQTTIKAEAKQENSAVTRVRQIKKALPADLLAENFRELSDGLTLEEFFSKFIEEDLPQNLQTIAEAETTAHANLKIKLILDEHAHLGGQAETSVERQAKISNLVKQLKPAIAFAEGIRFSGQRMTIASQTEDLKETGRKMGWNQEKINRLIPEMLDGAPAKFWHASLLNSPIKIFGVDYLRLNQLVLILDMIERSGKTEDLDISFLNYGIRERLILSNVIQVMEEQQQSEAVIVLGAAHKLYFPDLCQQWVISCEIIYDYNLP